MIPRQASGSPFRAAAACGKAGAGIGQSQRTKAAGYCQPECSKYHLFVPLDSSEALCLTGSRAVWHGKIPLCSSDSFHPSASRLPDRTKRNTAHLEVEAAARPAAARAAALLKPLLPKAVIHLALLWICSKQGGQPCKEVREKKSALVHCPWRRHGIMAGGWKDRSTVPGEPSR